MVFHINWLRSFDASAEDGTVGAVLFAVCDLSAFDVAIFDDEREVTSLSTIFTPCFSASDAAAARAF